jgi:DNA mismatch repair protein MutS2
MDLADRTRAGLDWPVLLDAWARSARTPMGAAAVRSRGPLPSRDAALHALDGCAEVLALEEIGAPIPVGGVTDIGGPVGRAARGQVLEAGELKMAGSTLRCLLDLRAALDDHRDEAPTLAERAAVIEVDPFVTETLERAFDPSGRLSGTTYPELDELRRAITELQGQVRSTLDELVRGEGLGDLLQDRFVTVRENRYVLPIKAHAKNWDLGIVHDTSGSGATVYVEPHAVVQLNNRLRLAEGKLAAAEHRILAGLSTELGTQHLAVTDALAAAVDIDVACSRATFARSLRAHRPVVGTEGVVRLTAARHPVLVLREVPVVANDLRLRADHPVLVLSGPNAGGKTVALKTIGLCAALVRHGCYIPAEDGSRVDFFDGVLAAIGDQQTVEGDLSSFSAHLVTLRAMLSRAQPGWLLLLDEIASGTDPSQGAALAQAVLERFADQGARIVVTTHYAALKALATTDDRFAVAAVQYANGRPTYRVLQGATGESHAFSIAAEVGLDPQLLARAESLMGEHEANLSRLLEQLEAEQARAHAATEALVATERALAERAEALERREARIAAKAKELEHKQAAAFLQRLQTAEKAIGQVVADLQRNPSHTGAKAARATVEALRALAPSPEVDEAPPEPVQPAQLSVGDRVRLVKLGREGEVVAVGDGGVQVQAGGLTVRARPGELQRLGGQVEVKPTGGTATTFQPKARGLDEAVRVVTNTLDLRGKRVDEAQDECERFFDAALLRGYDSVFLLHGHGTGALKDGLRRWLRSSAYVTDWAPASEEQGGDAFTIVALSEVQ